MEQKEREWKWIRTGFWEVMEVRRRKRQGRRKDKERDEWDKRMACKGLMNADNAKCLRKKQEVKTGFTASVGDNLDRVGLVILRRRSPQ